MHQTVDENAEELTEKQRLKETLRAYRTLYLRATSSAVRALEYYNRFRRVEDWSEDGTQEYIDILTTDSKRFLKEAALDIKRYRRRMDEINRKLIDLAAEQRRGA